MALCLILMSKFSSSLTNIVLTYRALKNISLLDLSDSRVFSWIALTQFLANSYKADLGVVKTSHHLMFQNRWSCMTNRYPKSEKLKNALEPNSLKPDF